LGFVERGFRGYWLTVGRAIVTTLAGLRVTWRYLFSRPITVEYPDALPAIPDQWRGQHAFERDRCIVCRQCERICPVASIKIDAEGKGKKARLLEYEINYGTCLFCNLCCDTCPVVCLWMTADWDAAAYTHEACVLRLDTLDPEQERAKLWPSLVDHPGRKKGKGKDDKKDDEKDDKEEGD
jgi:NADH-quinone oxidoreductase chain I